ncbi:MAG: hypothetical protein ACYDAN_15305 [Candidatus Limnocylindrales bacterium]
MAGGGRPPGDPAVDTGLGGVSHATPLTFRVALRRIATVAVLIAAVLALGAANDVGPLAQVTPPDQVTDPREMLSRSLQATIDASSVHLEATLSGHVPGPFVGRPDATVELDGTRATMDLRPQDARSHLLVTSAPLGIQLESLSLWDKLAYRESGGPWTAGSVAGLMAGKGIDANPMTLVDRLRAWLAAPGAPVPTTSDVPCAAPSGRCHQIRMAAGSAPGDLLQRLFPSGGATGIGATTTDVVLQTDAATLQPARLELDIRNADGTLALTVTIEASNWDWPSVIPEPSG